MSTPQKYTTPITLPELTPMKNLEYSSSPNSPSSSPESPSPLDLSYQPTDLSRDDAREEENDVQTRFEF